MNRLRQEGDWVLTIPASLYCHQRSYRNQKKSKNSLYSGNILITQDNLPSCVFIPVCLLGVRNSSLIVQKGPDVHILLQMMIKDPHPV